MTIPKLDPRRTLFFLCDIQTKFRPAIYGYDQVIATANKMIKLAKILGCEVVATTQNARALGPIDPAIDIESLGPLLLGNFDKTAFSMVTPDVEKVLASRPAVDSVVVFGIESHICVLQTTLSLLARKYTPHIIADGVSSCNAFEIPIALNRLCTEGAVIGTSESVAFQLMGDASLPTFKAFSRFVKEEKDNTKQAGDYLLLGKTSGTSTPAKESEIANGGVVLELKSSM
ncbi:Isochorismatase-like protein [Crucibulum laeve]|uniref:Isochorismatase-like protein n=1 Tax=Crucibulum laeve TaxID=68775 RepID=A0A5C3MFA4_9AGAR|nr:Isochorismatase-like protein [Crucibulum laeve]